MHEQQTLQADLILHEMRSMQRAHAFTVKALEARLARAEGALVAVIKEAAEAKAIATAAQDEMRNLRSQQAEYARSMLAYSGA